MLKRTKYLSADQMDHLQGTIAKRSESGIASDIVAWLVVDVALQTGLRVGELAMLTRASLDFDQRLIHAQRLKKTKKDHATGKRVSAGPQPCELPMSATLHAHLKAYCAWLTSRSQIVDPHACLFLGKRGPMTRRGLQQAWSKALERAELPKLSIHSARHTFAVAVRQATNDIVVVQKMLGHSDPKTTAVMYADVPFEERQAALDKVFG